MQMDFYISHDFALQSLSSNGGTGDAIVDMRKESESIKYSYSGGARFGFTFPSGMGIKTGLNISKVKRGFSYEESDGTPMDTTMGTIDVSSTNTYTYIDIPLLFSWEMPGYGPFYYNLNVGVLFNMTLTSEGKFLDEFGNVRNFTRGAENKYDAYEKVAGSSLYASFGFHYVYNDLIDFIVEPNIRYAISPFTIDEYPVDEKHSTVGLITGMRYKF